MSEYTSYWMIHTGDIGATCSALTAAGETSVLFIDFDHPCRSDRERAFELWKALPYHQQWAVLVHGVHDGSGEPDVDYWEAWFGDPFADRVSYLLIDEDTDRWRFAIGKESQHLDLLFSDRPWADCNDVPEKDWARIERAKNLSEGDLAFLEECLGLPHSNFKHFLAMGKVFEFLNATGLPSCHMFDQNLFYFPPEGYGRCMLWDEYERIGD